MYFQFRIFLHCIPTLLHLIEDINYIAREYIDTIHMQTISSYIHVQTLKLKKCNIHNCCLLFKGCLHQSYYAKIFKGCMESLMAIFFQRHSSKLRQSWRFTSRCGSGDLQVVVGPTTCKSLSPQQFIRFNFFQN